eukprot:gene47022-12494_t
MGGKKKGGGGREGYSAKPGAKPASGKGKAKGKDRRRGLPRALPLGPTTRACGNDDDFDAQLAELARVTGSNEGLRKNAGEEKKKKKKGGGRKTGGMGGMMPPGMENMMRGLR